jgi:hypothetical protein
MERVLSKVCYLLFGLAIKLRLYYLIVWFYSNIIKERMADGRMVCPSNTSKNGDIIILALTSDHFRTDLDVLGETGKFRILQIMFPWQNRLVDYFLRCRMERNILVNR